MRRYEETHPWIKFHCDLRDARPTLWIALGEAASKVTHLSNVPLQPSTSRKLLMTYLAKGAAATTAIEGNSLSEEQVLQAVQGKLEVPRSKEYLKQEVDNVISLFNRIKNQIAINQLPPITLDLVQGYNREILANLTLEDDVRPGMFRSHSVVVGNVHRGAPAEDCEYLTQKLCEWLDSETFSADPGLEKVYAIIKAVIAHLYLAWIHPFGDGNGRTARMVEFHILMSAGFPTPAAHLLSNHYNETRAEYYRQLDRASKSGGEILPFIEYAVVGLVDQLREQLDQIYSQIWQGTWTNLVHDKIQRTGTTASRRRRLALALGAQEKVEWLDPSDLPKLSQDLAAMYAGKGSKTIQRDINSLKAYDLIERVGLRGKIRAKREIVFGLLPVCRRPPFEITTPPVIGPDPNQLPIPFPPNAS